MLPTFTVLTPPPVVIVITVPVGTLVRLMASLSGPPRCWLSVQRSDQRYR